VNIAFFGLGRMGAPMAANLAKAGHTVHGFDPAQVAVQGLTQVRAPQDAAAQADVVITMLQDGATVLEVYAETIGVAPAGALFLDCSTVDVASAVEAAKMAEKAGHSAVDAPVSGGVAGAAAGTLTFMAGGDAAAFARARPLFDVMGGKAVHCGRSGAGQAAKICNNMILGVTMIATCEAIVLADRLGLDRNVLFDVVSTSSGSNWSMNTYCPAPGVGPDSPADHDYAPGFAAELMLKDLRLGQAAAEAVDADTPLGALATEIYSSFVETGGKGRDFSAILLRLADRRRASHDA
jgi:3-hydroxyisobutyrate dehydrogenase